MKKNEDTILNEAVSFLLNKAKLTHAEALEFRPIFPEWTPNGVYPMNSYVTYGTDEFGNKKLFFVTAKVEMGNTRIPGEEPVSGCEYYNYICDPNIGKED